ncbi:MAG TPA: galactokinase [Clostridiales bacterium]|jgi:galactokinase|nr:galactokinase [Clostridiales bacterium]
MDFTKLKKKFAEIYGEGEIRVFSAAGRVNLIGEHIDYNGGYVLPAALNLRCAVLARPNNTDKIRIAFTTLDERVVLDKNNLQNYKHLKYGNYQAGVAYVMQEAGFSIVGCDLLYDSTVPFGSGLSSSAAIEVSTALALATFSKESGNTAKDIGLVELAVLSQKAENRYVGVNSGIMDQFASAMGKKDHAILLDCSTLKYEYVPLNLLDYSLVIINTNKPRSLADSKYNERRAECEEALKILQKSLDIDNLCEISPQTFEANKHLLSGKIKDRAEHCVYEQDRVIKSIEALKKGDLIKFGQLLNESHKSLKELYEVTGIELDTLAETAQKTPGCIGSRMTGAGFGGCAVSLVKTQNVQDFVERVTRVYTQKIGYSPSVYNTSIADGAYEIKERNL